MLFSPFLLLSRVFHLILGIGTPQSYPPPLSSEEEAQYFRAYADGNESARQTIILHNLRLVSHIVRKYYPSAKDPEDLVSIGTIGLMKAVDSFSVENGAKFATYASRCIQNEILMYFRSQKKLSGDVSLNETIDVDRDGNPLTYMDVIRCEEDMTEEIADKILTDRMLFCMDSLLSKREKQILTMRYGLGGAVPRAQREVAEVLGISRSYVSRIEKAAIEKLRDALT